MIDVTKSLDWILQIENPSDYKVALEGHGIDNAHIELIKGKREYRFKSSTPIIKGVQTHKELQFKEADNIVLSKEGHSFTLKGIIFLLIILLMMEITCVKLFPGLFQLSGQPVITLHLIINIYGWSYR